LTRNLFQNNHATGNGIGGGAIFAGDVTSHADRFISNTAGTFGGGLDAHGLLTITAGVFTGNIAGNTAGINDIGSGGLIANSLFAGNVVTGASTPSAAGVCANATGLLV
jgi:predicted outer membrane repeat protein